VSSNGVAARREEGSYIRGAGGVEVEGRRVALFLVALLILILAALVIPLTVLAAEQNSRISRLQSHGVAVNVTVTGCLGMASGTGITESGYQCRGTFTLDGHPHNDVISGSNVLLPVGQPLRADTVRGDPSILYAAGAAATMRSSWKAYTLPAILLVVLIAALITWCVLRARWSGRTRALAGGEPLSRDSVPGRSSR